MLRQFRRWSLSQSDQGPIYLGYRLGHLENDLRVYRALVYNKGAGVLHMLRRLLGDETFFRALGRFYADRRFQKAGTDDLQRVFEAESGRSLGRFFERWIYGTGIPKVRFSWRSEPGAVIVSLAQAGPEIYDLPVTVTITFADGRTRDVVVALTDARAEQSIPVDAQVRTVQVNRDSAAIAEFSDS
jgi:aminopeptidase N